MSLRDFVDAGIKEYPEDVLDVTHYDPQVVEELAQDGKTAIASRILALPPAQQRKALALLERVTATKIYTPRIKRSFHDFCLAAKPDFQWLRVHEWFQDEIIMPLIKGEIQNVMINAPPRTGKSEIFSKLLPAYLLEIDPTYWVGLSSYGAELAEMLSRSAKDFYEASGHILREDVARADYWQTPAGGGMWSTGVRGKATGKGGNWLICDDPVKDAEEAKSDVIQERNFNWWKSTWRTRRHPRGTRKLIIMTRWHPLDLGGRILETITETSEKWHIAVLPQEYDPTFNVRADGSAKFPKHAVLVPDFRKEKGELLTPEWYDRKTMNEEREGMGDLAFEALQQQNPTNAAGTEFKAEWMKQRVRVWPEFGQRWSVGVDTAGTDHKDNPRADLTCVVAMCRLPNGKLFLSPMMSCRKSPARRNADIKKVFHELRKYGVNAKWLIEPEKGVDAKARTHTLGTELMGARITYIATQKNKTEHADPLRTQMELGNVILHENEHLYEFMDHLLSFPNGTHDDWVDAASLAFSHHSIARFTTKQSRAR